MKNLKMEAKKALTIAMGETYDQSIVLDALFEEPSECFLFSGYQVKIFNAACRKYHINRVAIREDDYWKIEEVA